MDAGVNPVRIGSNNPECQHLIKRPLKQLFIVITKPNLIRCPVSFFIDDRNVIIFVAC
jgi:hypothetical protein